MIRKWICAAALAACIATAFTVPVHAQAKADLLSSFGAVDVDKVREESAPAKAMQGQLQALFTKLQSLLEWRGAHLLLEDTEAAEYISTMMEDKPADAQKAKADELAKKATELNNTLSALRQKNPLSDQEKAELQRLSDLEKKSKENLGEFNRVLSQRFAERRDELSEEFAKDVLVAVEAVAKERKLALVFNKSSVLYAAVDITADVIKKLNAQKK